MDNYTITSSGTLRIVSEQGTAGEQVASVLEFLKEKLGSDVYEKPYGHPTAGPALCIPADEMARNGGKVPDWANRGGGECKNAFASGFHQGSGKLLDRKLYHVSQSFGSMELVNGRYQRVDVVFVSPHLNEQKKTLEDFVSQASQN